MSKPFKRLVKLIARAFYDNVTFSTGEKHQEKSRTSQGIVVVVLEALARRQWVREEDLAKDLMLHGKMLRRCLHFLEKDKFIRREHRKETAKGVKLHTQSYCCLDYSQIYDVVRYRLHHMQKKLKADADKKNKVHGYICLKCTKRYSDFDAPRLISFETGDFHCENCNSELVKEADKKDDNVWRLHEKMRVQLKPLMEQLNRIKDLDPPDFGTLQAWEVKSSARTLNDCSMFCEGNEATPMPYFGDMEVEVILTGSDQKDKDITKPEHEGKKPQPLWMAREETRNIKELPAGKPKSNRESRSFDDLKDDTEMASNVEDYKSLQDEYLKAYCAEILSKLKQQRVVGNESDPSNGNAFEVCKRQVGVKFKHEQELAEEDDVEWVEEDPNSTDQAPCPVSSVNLTVVKLENCG